MITRKKRSAKKKESIDKSAFRDKSETRRLSGKETSTSRNEISGIHVINSQDIEDHFGTSDNKKDDGSSEVLKSSKAEVFLQLDEQVLNKAQSSAAKLGLELPQYIELVLNRFEES